MNDLQVPYNEGGDFIREVPTLGEHQTICSQIHNLGHQVYNGKTSISPKVVFVFEIEQKMKEGKFQGNQMVVSKEFAMYFGKDNDLRTFIGNWRGKALSDDEAKKFNLSVLLNKPATLVIIHNQGKNGKTYANIAGIAPPKKDFTPISVTFKDEPKWITDKKAAAVPAPVKHSEQSIPPPEESDLPF